jgi:hypothetical protein
MTAEGAKIAPANNNEPIKPYVRNTIIPSNRSELKTQPVSTMFPAPLLVCPIQHMCPITQAVRFDILRAERE